MGDEAEHDDSKECKVGASREREEEEDERESRREKEQESG